MQGTLILKILSAFTERGSKYMSLSVISKRFLKINLESFVEKTKEIFEQSLSVLFKYFRNVAKIHCVASTA